MAVIKNNPVIYGASGMLGRVIVFKKWKGKTVLCSAPRKPKTESILQNQNRKKFKMASIYAKRMMQDPGKKAEYKE